MFKFVKKFFDHNRKELKRLSKLVDQINGWEPEMEKLTDAGLKKKTPEFKERLSKGEDLASLLPEAFALVREVSKRTVGMRPYDVQLIAAVALFEGKIAEQKTGEGKTLSAVPALYLRALRGRGAHLVTVNDYLARRDAGWMGPIFAFLGVSVGCIIPEKSFIYDLSFEAQVDDERLKHLRSVERKEAYRADVTYGTSNEFGFDYLRDNRAYSLEEVVQREHYFAVVDEVDFALIDEARTPLIISSPSGEKLDRYQKFSELARQLQLGTDYILDEKARTAMLTDYGIKKLERELNTPNLYEEDFETIHHIENALKAQTLFNKDKDYVIKDGQVIIVDEFTGRLMPGRRWSDGLHQAVEAKEGVEIQQESKTWATITFQNYFRMYKTLAGMTGTAATEAEEFKKIYDLDVVSVPTNKPLARRDEPDLVYKTQQAKYAAVARETAERFKKGQPVLIGTTSIEKNEIISHLLKKKGIPHQVLNAKNHQKEAGIIAQAGRVKAVTVATNMAGRGVDIILGGEPPKKVKSQKSKVKNYEEEYKKWQEEHDRVIKLGGLHVMGTERHEARRVDNQLRGRSGRQGDPGSSQFFVALDDDLMRIFGGEQISGLMTRFNMPENMPISHSMVNKVIEQIQVKVEGFNFDIRKSLVEFDDVVARQREIVYQKRRQVLEWFGSKKRRLRKETLKVLRQEVANTIAGAVHPETMEKDMDKVVLGLAEILAWERKGDRDDIANRLRNEEGEIEPMEDKAWQLVKGQFLEREKQIGEEISRDIERFLFIHVLDNLWVDHLTALEALRDGVRLRGYGQRDPLVEYRREGFAMFKKLLANFDYHFSRRIFRIQIAKKTLEPALTVEARGEMMVPGAVESGNVDGQLRSGNVPTMVKPVVSGQKKVGRNDPCWCGSGKKWKKCHYPQLK